MNIAVYRLMAFAVLSPLLSATGGRIAPPSPDGPGQEMLIAAAADLKFAMDSLVAVFRKIHPGMTIKVVYGSSGNFFQQIGNGAPFDLFFSADIDYPRELQEKGVTASPIHVYGTGQLVLWSKTFDPSAERMNSLLSPTVKKIAIANPAHAPYGRRAEESLRHFGLYDKIKDKLVLGENIAQTAQYAQTGAADAAVIALSLALSPEMQHSGGKYWLIPAGTHQPLEQAFVLLPHGRNNKAASAFIDYFLTPEARAVLKSFGFSKP